MKDEPGDADHIDDWPAYPPPGPWFDVALILCCALCLLMAGFGALFTAGF